MLALIITIVAAIMTLTVCILSEHKEEIYEELNEKSNSLK